jgi:hypothetical protein
MLFCGLQCLRQPPAQPPANKPTGTTTGTPNQPPATTDKPPAAGSPEKLKSDLTCGCARAKPAAVAVAQALAAAGGDCSSPAGQALAQAYAQAVASGTGQAVAQALAVANASAAQKVGDSSVLGMRPCYHMHNSRSDAPSLKQVFSEGWEKPSTACAEWPVWAPVTSNDTASCACPVVYPYCKTSAMAAHSLCLPPVSLPAVPEAFWEGRHLHCRLCGRLLHQQRPGSWRLLRPWRSAQGHQHQPPCDRDCWRCIHSLLLLSGVIIHSLLHVIAFAEVSALPSDHGNKN